jgi:hypothetical protein
MYPSKGIIHCVKWNLANIMRTAATASNLFSTWPVTGIAFSFTVIHNSFTKGVLKEKSVTEEKKGQDDSEWKGLHKQIHFPKEFHSFSNYINVDNYIKVIIPCSSVKSKSVLKAASSFMYDAERSPHGIMNTGHCNMRY